jgi:hypothetical protein
MSNMMKTAEKALFRRADKMLAGATRRYKKFMRQAAKAASDHKREQYVAAALGALVVTGVVANKMMRTIKTKPLALRPAPATAGKKRKKARAKTA